ncbi:hypothetical protein EJ06DRAFT_584936 [Trichodelitschia bisporula]|uniref:2-methoxy-6-polyprenyl-1,4-benzoquinol methylase, mitochondrial n=1 Tax=Trichodelitschia bisporula TaxID=703511 RepID=A0A6G1HMC4_9PEZI|nr:hypothetical protein EJ06DRAFT_584936 [Trichodelitschia bisporula]
MATSRIARPLARRLNARHVLSTQATPLRAFSYALPARSEQPPRTTHFGFETVPEDVKQSRVASVFSSVATSYDTMNDLMSLGIHRLWKDHFVRALDPGINPLIATPGAPPLSILDVAGGTGDIAFRLLEHAGRVHGDNTARVMVADINPDMLAEGRRRAAGTPYLSQGRLEFVEANAEVLSMVPDASVDIYTVAFGIRNFTNIRKALAEAHRILKPGGVFACLEFSKVGNPVLDAVYKRWSFGAIPLIGQVVAGDRKSYQYLVESIERFPSQTEFAGMIKEGGFLLPEGGGWEDLSMGIACVHKGIKPVEEKVRAEEPVKAEKPIYIRPSNPAQIPY